jgi:hypothetical protein
MLQKPQITKHSLSEPPQSIEEITLKQEDLESVAVILEILFNRLFMTVSES